MKKTRTRDRFNDEDTMKKILYILPAVAMVLFSCSKVQEGPLYDSNGDDGKEIHFIQSSLEKEFGTDLTEGTIDVVIARPGNSGDYSVGILNRGDDSDAFSIPESVTIPDGAYSVTVPVEVDLSKLIRGSSLKTSFYIREREAALGDNSAYVSRYTDKMTVSVSFELVWEEYYRQNGSGEEVRQTATFIYNGFYTGRATGLTVDRAEGTNIFRVNDWASGVGFRFILNEDNTCTVPAQSIGYFNSNYNEYVYVSDMAVYLGDDTAYGTYPCSYDGNGTFTFNLIYYVSAGYFSIAEETLIFESDASGSPEMAIEYGGIETSETGVSAARLSFYANDYVKYYKATVVSGDLTANATLQNSVRQQLIDGQAPGSFPVLTLYEDNSDLWNIPAGNFTAVALAYDGNDRPCNLYTLRFTCDPDGSYSPQVLGFDFYNDPSLAAYSPYSTLFWSMSGRNIVSLKYICMRTDMFDYICDYYGLPMEELIETQGNTAVQTIIDNINGDGFTTYFSNMVEGMEYTLAVLVKNSFGDSQVVTAKASTMGRSYEDFDRTKTMADFLGAFSATATGTVSGSSGSTSSALRYRVDISRKNDTQVLITGLSDMRDFTPAVSGYYDEELHAVVIEPQPLGTYRSDYAFLGMSDGFSIYWGGCSMAIGYIGDTLYCLAAPGSTGKVYSYQFLLFSSETANSSTYLRESVGSKTYSSLSLSPLALAPSASSVRDVSGYANEFRAGDRTVTSYLMHED